MLKSDFCEISKNTFVQNTSGRLLFHSISFYSNSGTSLLTNLLHHFLHQFTPPLLTQHGRFYLLLDFSASENNNILFCFSLWCCKVTSIAALPYFSIIAPLCNTCLILQKLPHFLISAKKARLCIIIIITLFSVDFHVTECTAS